MFSKEETARDPSTTKMAVPSSTLVSSGVIPTMSGSAMPSQSMIFADKEHSHTNLPQKSTSVDDEPRSKLNTNKENVDDVSATRAVQVTETTEPQQCHDNDSRSVPIVS